MIILVVDYLLENLAGAATTQAAFAAITPAQVALFTALGVVNLATNWPPIAIALPGLPIREAAVTNTASAALSNTVPEGGAVATGLKFAMLRSWGFALSDITSEVVLTAVLGFGLPASGQAAVLAAVLLYRLATFLVPIPIGLVSYLYWRRSKAWRRPVDSRRVHLAAQPLA